ncbi:MAG: endosialidase [Lachnospiraceae bacterium]|jgi:DnaJ-class molecular chaperone|uniref:Endosialidase n=1 Tax=Hominisplanchenecus murintestinalis TaxID=2941517 RepID=A0AC61QVW6_9FIRM|nr:endosialidase [Hominisplanchenecus murintestinalis]MCI9517521.1 endosialidase [Lachnospiraceae bacterium]MCI9662070.1 endosialidase [Lachnospiraceae bacterium]TGX96799.1 endosialidase [Hominisplanchenecus murintestinalis]
MSVISELIRTEADGTISFGNYELSQKSKISDFEHKGDLYKVKTFKEITKLERNGMFVYESVPGSAVKNLSVTETGMTFEVEAPTDVQITVELEEDTHYQVSIDGKGIGEMKTNLGGKLVLSVELDSAEKEKAEVQIEKA